MEWPWAHGVDPVAYTQDKVWGNFPATKWAKVENETNLIDFSNLCVGSRIMKITYL